MPEVPSSEPGKRGFPNKLKSGKDSPMPPYHWAPSFQHGSLGSMDRNSHAVSRKYLKMHASMTKRAIFRKHYCLPSWLEQPVWKQRDGKNTGIRGWCCHWVWQQRTKNCLRDCCLSAWRWGKNNSPTKVT